MASAAGQPPRPRDALNLRLFVDGIPTLAWSSRPDGSLDFANHRWNEYTGLSLEESCGWGWKTAVHPEDLPRLVSAWESPQDNDIADSCELRLRRSDGVFRWFLLQREPLRDEAGTVVRWYAAATEIEQRKQVEQGRFGSIVQFYRRSSRALCYNDYARGPRRKAALARWRTKGPT